MLPKADKDLTTIEELTARLNSVKTQYDKLHRNRKSWLPSDAMLRLEQRANDLEQAIADAQPYPRTIAEPYWAGATLAEFIADGNKVDGLGNVDCAAYTCLHTIAESPTIKYVVWTTADGQQVNLRRVSIGRYASI